MRTFLIVVSVWVAFFMFACKDEPQGYGEDQGCNCGIVCEDGIDLKNDCYWFIVENECSGSKKRFCVDPLIWNTYTEGDRICINEQSPW